MTLTAAGMTWLPAPESLADFRCSERQAEVLTTLNKLFDELCPALDLTSGIPSVSVSEFQSPNVSGIVRR
jgi:hypothetical protein